MKRPILVRAYPPGKWWYWCRPCYSEGSRYQETHNTAAEAADAGRRHFHEKH